ncbi:MAG TPA: hypothetical protein VMZ28_28940 [Kofleriaceae bacterium]|nr:hypothetical protein [Kofleriaceae bacterium]
MRTALGLVFLLAAACGGGDDDFEAPTCEDGEVRLEGDVGGGSFDDSRSGYSSYVFVNALNDEDGQLDIGFPDGDTLSLRFPDLTANGDSVDVRGSVSYPSVDLDVGNCEDSGFPGILRLDDDGDGGTFLLTSLREGSDYCDGDGVGGEITGCYRSAPF